MKKYSRSEIEALARQVKNELGEDAAVVLIGSVARSCATRRSDIDLLLVADHKPSTGIRAPRFEFHPFSRSNFLENLRSADDFPNWCVRYGVPLEGGKYWDQIVESLGQDAKWPEWRRKVEIAGRRWLAAHLFLESGDADAAGESALFAFDHLIRALLLREGVFPLSRPELVKQIEPWSPQIGASLHTLLNEPWNKLDFARTLQPLSATLNSVDAEAHQKLVERLERILARPGDQESVMHAVRP